MHLQCGWSLCVLVLVGAFLGCEEGEEQSEPVIPDVVELPEAVSLSISVPEGIREYETISLGVEAIDASGVRALGFDGAIKLTLSGGGLSSDTLLLEQGFGEVEVWFNREGNALLEAVGEGLKGEASLFVGAPDWRKDPSDWILSGNYLEAHHWTFGGFWNVAAIGGEDEWIGFASTSATAGLDAGAEVEIARIRSTDFGATWTVEPDAPVLTGVLSADVREGPGEGEWHLWGVLQAAPRVIRKFVSFDAGLSWEPSDCEVELGKSAWNAGGIETPSVVRGESGLVSIWFTGWTEGESDSRGTIGWVQGECSGEWGNPQVVQGVGASGSWNAASVHSPHVWREEGVWKMLFAGQTSFTGSPGIGYMRSDDGIIWDPSVENPLVQKSAKVPVWDARGVDFPATVKQSDGTRTLFFSGIPADRRPRLVRALATD